MRELGPCRNPLRNDVGYLIPSFPTLRTSRKDLHLLHLGIGVAIGNPLVRNEACLAHAPVVGLKQAHGLRGVEEGPLEGTLNLNLIPLYNPYSTHIYICIYHL